TIVFLKFVDSFYFLLQFKYFIQEWQQNPRRVLVLLESNFVLNGMHIYCLVIFVKFSNNMLYPKEDKLNRVLVYSCRNCSLTQPADNPCIYVNKLSHEVE